MKAGQQGGVEGRVVEGRVTGLVRWRVWLGGGQGRVAGRRGGGGQGGQRGMDLRSKECSGVNIVT